MGILREEDRKILWNFFAAHFHQDWICESETPGWDRGPLSTRCIARTGSDVYDNDAVERILLRDLGCFYSPGAEAMTAKEWLCGIVRILSPKPNRKPLRRRSEAGELCAILEFLRNDRLPVKSAQMRTGT